MSQDRDTLECPVALALYYEDVTRVNYITINILSDKYNIYTVKDVIDYGYDNMIAIPGIGRMYMKHICDFIRRIDPKMADDFKNNATEKRITRVYDLD